MRNKSDDNNDDEHDCGDDGEEDGNCYKVVDLERDSDDGDSRY